MAGRFIVLDLKIQSIYKKYSLYQAVSKEKKTNSKEKIGRGREET